MKKTKFRSFCLYALSALALISTGCTGSDSSSDPQYQSCLDVANLSEFQQQFGSYKASQKISFSHSNGYTFFFEVTDYDKSADDFCNMNSDVLLESTYPIYSIHIHSSISSVSLDKAKRDTISVTFGQYQFTLMNPDEIKALSKDSKGSKDELENYSFVDTLKINNNIYTDVYEVIGRMTTNETVESDPKLYYQVEKGILKIVMDDGSYIAINEKEKK